jgi:LysM repeat protein
MHASADPIPSGPLAILQSMTTAAADSPRPAGDPRPSTTAVDARAEDLPRPSAAEANAEHVNPRGCPFLVADTGGWRLDMPTRDHRCAAFTPPASLSPEKQARLCLTPAHTGCATYLASLTARTERLGAAPVRRATRWGLARTTSVIEDPGGIRARVMAVLLDRRRWPAIPAVILVTTLFVLALSGFRAGVPTSPVATASPGVGAASSAGTPRVTPRPAGTSDAAASAPATAAPETAPPPTAKPTKAPATPKPSATFRTYVVKAGDTLTAIAARFGTTVSAMVRLNDLPNRNSLSVGQVLRIP